eukprot:CAMPEP_0172895844 /NCGR_PEP_ID=MMETSP1075-20121228/154058_1 /TAXON_ID=2916 /ORGANISM="Ceratium fusus, Strain PA161109" /LENGTH=114 /DNA_ID=CAMNT_0013751137 /DNA_START=66 /DNA_END=411 /DNA_ORIENTATION=-
MPMPSKWSFTKRGPSSGAALLQVSPEYQVLRVLCQLARSSCSPARPELRFPRDAEFQLPGMHISKQPATRISPQAAILARSISPHEAHANILLPQLCVLWPPRQPLGSRVKRPS